MAETSEAILDAVVFDYGGVLTSAVRDTTAHFIATDDIDPAGFAAVMREWMARDAADGSPVHRLETGALSAVEFETALAARLSTTRGAAVVADGLLARLFAAMRPDEDMLTLLRDLRARSVKVGVLSNSWANTYPEDLPQLCDAVVISGEVGLRKPDPAIYRLALERLDVPAARAAFVDDAPVNVEAATALGMRAIRHTDAASTRATLAEFIPGLGKVAS